MAIGVRTKAYECFKVAKCVSVQMVELRFPYDGSPESFWKAEITITVDGRELTPEEVKMFVINDGFDTNEEFILFFTKKGLGGYNITHVFKLIHWTDKRY